MIYCVCHKQHCMFSWPLVLTPHGTFIISPAHYSYINDLIKHWLAAVLPTNQMPGLKIHINTDGIFFVRQAQIWLIMKCIQYNDNHNTVLSNENLLYLSRGTLYICHPLMPHTTPLVCDAPWNIYTISPVHCPTYIIFLPEPWYFFLATSQTQQLSLNNKLLIHHDHIKMPACICRTNMGPYIIQAMTLGAIY